jgi:beta-lactamase regulating signal transducer with metallopeptidase domain
MQLHAIAAAVPWMLGDNHVGLLAAFAHFAQAISPVAAQTVARMVIDAMWQGAAIAFALYLSLRITPRVSAVHRFAAWTAGFAAVAALPFLPLVVHLVSASSSAAADVSAASAARPWLQFDSRWAFVIAALWLIASALRFAELIFHTLRLRRLWNSATPIADQPVLKGHDFGRADNADEKSGALAPEGRSFQVCITNQLDRPSVIGFFSPRILIPDWLYARLTPQELAQVVLHEAEHLRRHDDWTNLIQKFVLVLFPLNPALAWIERRLCREREMACDEGVVSKTQAPRAYAVCLAGLAERRMQRDLERKAAALSLAAWRRRPELVHRVQSILRRQRALHPVAARALLGSLTCGLLAASVELARCPQLVAFVAPPQPPQIAQADAVMPDRAVYTPVSSRSFASNKSALRLVDAKAILPSRREALTTATSSRATQHSATSEIEIASRDAHIGTPHATYLKAETPSPNSEQAAPSVPRYFIFTAVEQVQTVPQNSREISDYDTSTATDANSAVSQHPASADSKRPAPVPHITITRLILKIAPASSATVPATTNTAAPNAATSHATGTMSVGTKPDQQPTIIPIGNGWLVLQL